jgi:AraC-like DNA-binding protein
MELSTALNFICSIAIGHCIFLAVALLIMSSKLSNKILAVLVILLGLREGKSLVWLIIDKVEYPVSVIGVITMAWIGPNILLFLKSFFNSGMKFERINMLHFVPGALVIPFLWADGWSVLNLLYYTFTIHLLIYVGGSVWHLTKNRTIYSKDDVRWRWTIAMLIGLVLITTTFVLQVLVYQPLFYTLNILISCFVFYGLSLIAVRISKLFIEEPKKQNNFNEAYEALGKRIELAFEQEEMFIDPNLTISRLASKLKTQPYLVSKAVNYFFKKSFSEVLVAYRIKKSVQLLLTRSEVLSVEGIAYESGFNSLSAFYSAFKKVHQTTPAQFKKNNGNMDMKVA